jgi:putative ABC transport system permease protein
MPFDDIKEISGQDTYTGIRVSFAEGVDLELMKQNIERKLNPNNDKKTVEISSPQQAIDQFNNIIGVLQMIIGFVSSIALVVGGINVMNTMYSNILERINEISVMKALGGTNADIRNLFLIESLILGLTGAFIGFFLSYGLAELLSYLITNFAGYNVPINFDLTFFFLVMFITSFFSMLFGTYPAIRAARVNPADNLRDD